MITMIMAGFCPIPTTGTRKARRPILGIDCMIFAIPITIDEAFLFFVTKGLNFWFKATKKPSDSSKDLT